MTQHGQARTPSAALTQHPQQRSDGVAAERTRARERHGRIAAMLNVEGHLVGEPQEARMRLARATAALVVLGARSIGRPEKLLRGSAALGALVEVTWVEGTPRSSARAPCCCYEEEAQDNEQVLSGRVQGCPCWFVCIFFASVSSGLFLAFYDDSPNPLDRPHSVCHLTLSLVHQ